MENMTKNQTMANTMTKNGNQRVQEQVEEAQDLQAIQEGTRLMSRTLGIATTQVEEGGNTPEVGEMMTIDEKEVIGVTEVQVVKGGTMGNPEPTCTIMEVIVAADKGGVLENSARRLQANGSLL